MILPERAKRDLIGFAVGVCYTLFTGGLFVDAYISKIKWQADQDRIYHQETLENRSTKYLEDLGSCNESLLSATSEFIPVKLLSNDLEIIEGTVKLLEDLPKIKDHRGEINMALSMALEMVTKEKEQADDPAIKERHNQLIRRIKAVQCKVKNLNNSPLSVGKGPNTFNIRKQVPKLSPIKPIPRARSALRA